MEQKGFRFQPVSENDLDTVRSFYQSYKGTPGSTWNEYYPNEEILQLDYTSGNLYGLYKESELVGAISVSTENHLDKLPCWTHKESAKEIARVVISPKYQGKSYGTIMLTDLFKQLREQGVSAIHLLVSINNPRAINLYNKFRFENRGQYLLYEHDYYAMEVSL